MIRAALDRAHVETGRAARRRARDRVLPADDRGMSGWTFSVQREDFDAGAEARALTQGRADVGAVVTFVGLCRDEGGRLAALEIEHYPGHGGGGDRARRRGRAGAMAALGVRVIHRFGAIRPGEQIVLVATASSIAAPRSLRRNF